MAKESKLFSVQTQMNDKDYDDVFRIYLDVERGSEKRVAVATCVVLFLIFLVLMFVFQSVTFIFYGIGALVIGIAYVMVPANKKFVAQNKLMFGEKRETGFYPHKLTTIEILDDEEELTEEELEDATDHFQTGSITAYENERGFLFAEGKISNRFLYIPKRQLDEEEEEKIREFAKDRCSGGYTLLEMKSMLADENEDADDENDDTSFVSDVCNQYYGAKKLRLYDDDGHRIDTEEEEAAELLAEEDADDSHTEVMDAPDMDVEAEWEKIISDSEDAE